MAWQYSEKTTQLFMDAVQGKPGTHLGEIDDPDGFGEHGSIACGDVMRFTFRVRRDTENPTRDVITEQLLVSQNVDGSWSANFGSERNMGKNYCTSMAVLALAVEYQFLPIYQR